MSAVADDGWTVDTPEAVGLDGEALESVGAWLHDGTVVNVHSLLVARNGRLVFEEYGAGLYEDGVDRTYDHGFVHCTHSVTKSVTSALVGIALDRGLLSGLDVPLSSFFPEYEDIFSGAPKDTITLRHALSMTAGLRWDESSLPYTDHRNDHIAFVLAPDPLRFLFELPLIEEPGTVFRYNSGLSIALGRVIERATGLRADAFAEAHLFGPLGIDRYAWLVSPAPLLQTGGGLYLRPRDMLRFGQLFLDGGVHRGATVVSRDWVEMSTTAKTPELGYGFQWWLGPVEGDGAGHALFAALGRGGQAIYVVPGASLVVVTTAWNDGTHEDQGGRLLSGVLDALP